VFAFIKVTLLTLWAVGIKTKSTEVRITSNPKYSFLIEIGLLGKEFANKIYKIGRKEGPNNDARVQNSNNPGLEEYILANRFASIQQITLIQKRTKILLEIDFFIYLPSTIVNTSTKTRQISKIIFAKVNRFPVTFYPSDIFINKFIYKQSEI
jgi:hypothetical protein